MAAIAVLLVACSPPGSASTDPATSTPTVTRSAEAAPSMSPEEAAVAAYEAYTDAVVTALREGDADLPALEATAAGQALRNARRRVAANRAGGVVVTGDLEPSVTAADVQVLGDGDNAKVTDCVLNGLAHVNTDTDEVVAEATGWRQPVEATLARRGDGWRVTQVEVPLTDGSGPVPAPPGEAPLLRGPARAEAPPSCVLPDTGDAAVDAYLAFHDAYNTALGIGSGSRSADPDAAALPQTAVEPQLSAAREYLSTLASKGQAVRGDQNTRDPWPVAMLDFDDTVFVYDCVTQGDNAIVDVSSGDIVATNDTGVLRLDTAELTRSADGWKVVSWSVTEEGLEECTSPE